MTTEELPKIVCVDDEKTVLDTLTRVLKKNFDVFATNSTEEAYKYLSKNPDTAILLADLHMPGQSGMDLLRKAKQIAPTTVRAILSGHVDLRDMMVAVNQAKVDRFILKPWDNDFLELQMTEALQGHILLSEKKQLQHLAVTDPVTGLKNHRYFQETLRKEVQRAKRHHRTLSLIMVDIDYFKNFNDQYGHPIGDKALASVAQTLVGAVRSVDTVARYGGEEFALILPETDLQRSLEVAERLRTSVEGMPLPVDTKLTISLGVAQYKDSETPEEFLERADEVLYQSKKEGRNRTTCSK